MSFNLENYGVTTKKINRNLSIASLYEIAIVQGDVLCSNGAIVAYSGEKTGRCPSDKRVMRHKDSERNIDWGNVNIEISEETFRINLERAKDYLNYKDELFVFDGFAGWDKKYRLKIRVVCTRAYHALFMNNMLIRPTKDELDNFGEPDYVIFNAGEFPANQYTREISTKTSVSLSFEHKKLVILGTLYAGEMKKGVFTIMNYLMPKENILSMHCSCNEGKEENDISLFFGLSGTGKTTLSADPNRRLIGDDEHCWTNKGVFNIEGGCYAKCIDLKKETEEEIYNAIRYGSLLENVELDETTREPIYESSKITMNTRVSYPLEYISNVKIPAIGNHPKNIIFLTCDALGVLPPVSKLTPFQASYHFISGYTSKVAGTEMGIKEPKASFSACFGAPFLVWHPNKYAQLLAENMKKYKVNAWFINTGWIGGAYGSGKRISIKDTRAIIDAIHNGSLLQEETEILPVFNLEIPKNCGNISSRILNPRNSWRNQVMYDQAALNLANLFVKNFAIYEKEVDLNIKEAGPIIS